MPRGIVAQLRARFSTPSAFAMLPFQFFFEELDFDFETGDEPQKERRRLRMPGRKDEDDHDDEDPPSGGGGGPQWRRILILVIAIVVIGFGGYWYVKRCQRDNEVSAYKSYVRTMNAVTANSNTVGAKLRNAFLKQGQTSEGLVASIAAQVKLQQSVVTDAKAVSPPSAMSEVNREAVEAQQLRLNGLQGMAKALPLVFKTYDDKTGIAAEQAAELSMLLARVLAGDIVYSDSFKGPATAVLKEKNITGEAAFTDSQWMNPPMLEFVTPSGMGERLVTIIGGTPSTSPGGNNSGGGTQPGKLHGTGIKQVVVNGKQVSTGSTTVVGARDVGKNVIVATISNGGNYQETNVVVHAFVDGQEIGNPQTIAVFAAGRTADVTFPIEPSLDGTAQTIKIVVDPVDGETNTANNKATYKVLFSAAG